MQEEVTQRTVALCVEASKLSAGMLQQAMKKVLDEMQKVVTGHKTKLHHGKQTLRQLLKHNTSVSNIEITDQNIRAFSATAKKYGIDFALKKDTSGEIPRYLGGSLRAGMPTSSRRPSGSSPQLTWRKRKSPLSARSWSRRSSRPKPTHRPAGEGQVPKTGVWNYDG